jgi:hypothetical protein
MASVKLFIRKIPANTTLAELRDFIDSGVSWMERFRWGQRYRIIEAKILTIIDRSTREIEFHGLVTIEPDSLADQIIKRLHIKRFKGRRVAVRRYYKRSPLNDRRRDQDEPFASLQSSDKRCRDRRRQHQMEMIDDSIIKTTSMDTFYRKFL